MHGALIETRLQPHMGNNNSYGTVDTHDEVSCLTGPPCLVEANLRGDIMCSECIICISKMEVPNDLYMSGIVIPSNSIDVLGRFEGDQPIVLTNSLTCGGRLQTHSFESPTSLGTNTGKVANGLIHEHVNLSDCQPRLFGTDKFMSDGYVVLISVFGLHAPLHTMLQCIVVVCNFGTWHGMLIRLQIH